MVISICCAEGVAADDEEWQIRSDHVSMVVAPGHRASAFGRAEKVGVPYGSRARLIMFYVQSEAMRTSSRQVMLGRSMNQWLTRMGVPVGGKSMLSIKDQADRISRCSFTFDGKGVKMGGITRMTIFDRAIFTDLDEIPGQGTLFPQIAMLSEQFFKQLNDHPVPLEESAVRAISNNSMALDLYAWLAYRLHALKGTTPVSWAALKGQFGAGFETMFHFRPSFSENLRLALAVYRDARAEVTERGVDLYPSRPPISPRHSTIGRVQSLRSSRAVTLQPVNLVTLNADEPDSLEPAIVVRAASEWKAGEGRRQTSYPAKSPSLAGGSPQLAINE